MKPLEVSRHGDLNLGDVHCWRAEPWGPSASSSMFFPPELRRSSVTRLNFRLETSWGRDGVSACFCFSGASERVGKLGERRMQTGSKQAANRQATGRRGAWARGLVAPCAGRTSGGLGSPRGGSRLLTWLLLPARRGRGRSLLLPLEVGRFCHVDARELGLGRNGAAGCVCGVPEPASPSFWEA